MQQGLARLLGLMDYKNHSHALPEAMDCLVASVIPSSELRMTDVEARRNCITSIQLILIALAPQPSHRLSVDHVTRMYSALISGLEDYTTDERGDVGSWVRIASIQGLTYVSVTLLSLAKSETTYIEYIPANLYQEAIAGILKQGVGRLDNVRQHAGDSILCLLKCPLPTINDSNPWKFHGENLLKELLLSDVAEDDAARSHSWQNGSWIYPKAMNFLRSQNTGQLFSLVY